MQEVRLLNAHEAQAYIPALSSLLIECVQRGASISFMAGISNEQAAGFFASVVESVTRNERLLLAAFIGRTLVGTVQVVTATPENQPHRADVAKLLVSSAARGQGVGTALMQGAEEAGRSVGKSLLVLDTATGGAAERLYQRMGWQRVGVIPNYALFPNGEPCSTTIFWKALF